MYKAACSRTLSEVTAHDKMQLHFPRQDGTTNQASATVCGLLTSIQSAQQATFEQEKPECTAATEHTLRDNLLAGAEWRPTKHGEQAETRQNPTRSRT